MRARQARAVSCSLAASRPFTIPSARQVMREPPDLRAKVTPRGAKFVHLSRPVVPLRSRQNLWHDIVFGLLIRATTRYAVSDARTASNAIHPTSIKRSKCGLTLILVHRPLLGPRPN